jgi:uncharacterized protein (TIGR00288 family)
MSVIKHNKQRVGIFIDTQNLYHTAKNLYHARVNFAQIVKDALLDRSLIRATAYVITTEAGDEKAFFEALTKMGIEAKTKDLQIFAGGSKKADWDVGMAIDAVKLSPKLDAVVLVTGDGDFVPLVEYLQMHEGCQVEVVSFGKSTSSKLIEAADDFIDLDQNPKKYLLSTGGSPVYSRTIGSRGRSQRGERGERRIRPSASPEANPSAGKIE